MSDPASIDAAGDGQGNPIARMTDAEFEQHLRREMRLNPAVIEQFLRRIARINGGRVPGLPRSEASG